MFLKTIHHNYKPLITSLLLLLFTSFVQAQKRTAFDLLTPSEGATITLELDLTELINSKHTNQYFPGAITTPDGKMMKVEVRPRGKFRRRTCETPPLKLKFSKKDLRAAQLDTFNEVKMVIPCFNDPQGEELLLREYVAYRMYEQLSPYSVRARLVRVIFRDRHVEQDRAPVYCLMLEHKEQLEARLNGHITSLFEVPDDSLQTDQTALMIMFQYMIGNTDWSLADGRNLYMLLEKGSNRYRTIPYDFDFSGLVSAPYAVPNSETGIKKVQQRYMIAGHIPKEALQQASRLIESKRLDLLEWCNKPYMPKNIAKGMTTYLESFFQLLQEKSIEQLRPKGDLR
ncbi:MAG: hypothetical protein KDC61_06710 [Saprospiraceae bacterium]|nr:hypothetical protein [Saprospiraceae bacterium]